MTDQHAAFRLYRIFGIPHTAFLLFLFMNASSFCFVGRACRRFTLVELLAVIAVIGILSAILLPVVGKVREQAQRAKSASNLRSIAQAYAQFSSAGGRDRTIPSSVASVQDWAAMLAAEVGLVDASVYYIESDPRVADLAAIPASVGSGNGRDFKVDPEFVAALPSYAVVAGISPNAPASTTPLLFTRGLGADGRWGEDSPWAGDGGHIVFLDGHVLYYRDLAAEGGMLLHYRSQTRTSNILEAINPGAVVLNNP
jgi:prepilin-type N-terminal cleavage/methylation domain-containing protein/prepilin-type processing-associated H-X9-DG protein